jgi:hypothetical protein
MDLEHNLIHYYGSELNLSENSPLISQSIFNKRKCLIVLRSEYVVNVEQTRGSKSAGEKKRAVRLRNSKSTVRGVLNPSGLRIYPLNLKPDHTGRKKIVGFDPIKRGSSPVISFLITGLFFS